MDTPQTESKKNAQRCINQLQAGESLEDQVFMVSRKDLRTTTTGSLYIHMVFMDRTGQLVARIWQATQQQHDTITEGGFIRVRGRVESYKGHLQVIVDGLRPVDRREIAIEDFLPRTSQDIDAMWSRVLVILRTIRDPQLLALIQAFVKDEQIVTGFKKAPAAVQNHHAYIGGLLEHTCSVLELAVRIFGESDASTSHYPNVSRDLVLAGVFLHDIGKAAELIFETNIAYSTEGQLLGHITQAALWIDRKINRIEHQTKMPFPAGLRNVLIHIVLSHHGAYEFGSPRLPACPEAIVVHYLDNIDARLNMAFSAIEGSRDADSDWTEYVRPLETRVFKTDVLGSRPGPEK